MGVVAVSVGGVNLIDYFADAGHELIIQNILGRDPVEEVIQSEERPGGEGERFIESRLPSRQITIPYGLYSDNWEDMREGSAARRSAGRMMGRIVSRGLQRLEFDDQDGGYYVAKATNTEGDSFMPYLGRGTLTFYCPQPFLYGEEVTVSPSSGTVSIDSNHYVEPVILWTTSSSVGAAWIEVDGHRLTIDTGISSGQQIRIDCARKETRVGGVLNVENIHGVYPRVYDGSTVETSPGGEISFSYRERWI